MAKFIKTTDTSNTNVGPQVGYHDVADDFVLPLNTEHTKYEFVEEKEARDNHPALFGAIEAVEVKKSTKKVEEVKE